MFFYCSGKGLQVIPCGSPGAMLAGMCFYSCVPISVYDDVDSAKFGSRPKECYRNQDPFLVFDSVY